MKISDILSTNSIFTEVKANNKRQLLQELAIKMANMSQLDERLLSDAIMERENLGSTGYGRGTAFPHARIEGTKSVQAVFARLESPIDFDAFTAILDGKICVCASAIFIFFAFLK